MTTIEDVLAIEDDTGFAIALGELIFPRFEREGFGALTPPEQVAHCIHWLELEVNNGGFHQFFWNSAGDLASETLGALELIAAPRFADIMRRAIAAFPEGDPPADRDARCDVLDAAGIQ